MFTTAACHRQVCRLLVGLALLFAVTSAACSQSATFTGPTPIPLGADGGFPVSLNAPSFDTSASASDPPPAISGGTLAILPDGVTAVAADPDRDLIAVANLSTGSLTTTIQVQTHDEPGRLVADAAGHVHVILRRGGALVTIDPLAGTILARRTACQIPRGVAYDPATDLVHVACMGGELISFPAAGGDATRTLQLPRDLRDVVVDGNTLLVSQFRSAQVLVVDASGNVTSTVTLPTYQDKSARSGDPFTPSTAWRMRAQPGGGALMLHQRGTTGTVVVSGQGGQGGGQGGFAGAPGGVGSGYGSSSDPCAGLIHPALTPVSSSMSPPITPPIPGMVLPVDFALSSDGSTVAVIAAGNAHNPVVQSLFVSRASDLTDAHHSSCCPDGVHGPFGGFSMPGSGFCPVDAGTGRTCTQPTGEPEGVGFDGSNRVVVQTRNPSTIQIPEAGVTISISNVDRSDIGHEIFHANTGSGIACASCHTEGQEDGRTWNFNTEGPRRTMNVSGGIAGRVPYHWSGDLATFHDLVTTVYNGRMSGPTLSASQEAGAQSWMNGIPRLPGVVSDADAVTRGRAVFEDVSHGCASCHNGAQLTNDATNVDVGTGGSFKVPSLVGLAYTAPYLHNGCAATLADRFGSCGGGDQHGVTSTLTSDQLSDLTAYLDSL
jgi:mono/diheme cytochrome c family protein